MEKRESFKRFHDCTLVLRRNVKGVYESEYCVFIIDYRLHKGIPFIFLFALEREAQIFPSLQQCLSGKSENANALSEDSLSYQIAQVTSARGDEISNILDVGTQRLTSMENCMALNLEFSIPFSGRKYLAPAL